MTTHHSRSRTIGAGLVLLTLLASLLLSTHIVSLTHAAPPTHVPLTQYSQYPLSTVGKVFVKFTTPSTKIYGCTGTALVSHNESVVDTAAHCFYNAETGELAQPSNILFCPQYRDQSTPRGCWTGKRMFLSPKFLRVANPTLEDSINDYGFLVVSPLNRGTLQSVVGGVQALSSTAASNPVTVYGYPATPPYMGQKLYSAKEEAITTIVRNRGPVLQITNPTLKQQGTSGGPWFFTLAGTPYLIGHTASGNDNYTASPILDSAWSSLLSQAEQV